jgi:predicted membrane protein
VSLYTWTKGIAAGVYLVAALLVVFGFLRPDDAMWIWVTPIVSGAFLGLTGLLLIWDLEHPARFYMIFTRPQWRSWLVKGAFVIAGYSAVLAVHFLSSLAGSTVIQYELMIAGIPLSIMTAVYTAYLFAQAKARDLWQNPLLPPHLLVQAVLLGAAILMPLALAGNPFAGVMDFFSRAFLASVWILGIASLLHLLMIAGEVSLTHSTAHARVAVWEMMHGRYKTAFWLGVLLSIAGGVLPFLILFGYLSIGVLGAPLALGGLMLYEHAYVQAGQAVPLA